MLLAATCAPRFAFADEPPAAAGYTLAQAYKKARAFNEDVRISHENELAADSVYKGAWSILGPKVSITANGILETQEKYLFPGDTSPTLIYPFTLFTAGAIATQPLFRRGFWAARDAGRAGIEAAQAVATRTDEQLMLDVAIAYLNVMSSRDLLKLAHDAVTRAETQLSVSQARQKAGGALKTASQLAEVEVDRAKLLVAASEGDERGREVEFERLVGEQPPANLEMPVVNEVPGADVCLKNISRRSDIRALQQLAEQSRRLEDAARGDLWPTLDAQAAINYTSYLYPFGSIALWNARVVLTIPIFQGGAEYTKIRQQKIQTELQELQLSKQERLTRAAIASAANLVQTQQKAASIADAQVKIATEHYDLISAQFKVGAVTILDVANAQAVLIDAERASATARYATQAASYQLLFACDTIRL